MKDKETATPGVHVDPHPDLKMCILYMFVYYGFGKFNSSWLFFTISHYSSDLAMRECYSLSRITFF